MSKIFETLFRLFQPFKAKCANCNAWLVKEECNPFYKSTEVLCDKCFGELEAKQLDKPEE